MFKNKVKKGCEMLVCGVYYKAPNFKLSPKIVDALDPTGAHSQILPKVFNFFDTIRHNFSLKQAEENEKILIKIEL